jgi:hypothetical protein
LLPTEEILASEERFRAVQLAGPMTRGSLAVDTKITRQI